MTRIASGKICRIGDPLRLIMPLEILAIMYNDLWEMRDVHPLKIRQLLKLLERESYGSLLLDKMAML
jgi:hypothetical protein